MITLLLNRQCRSLYNVSRSYFSSSVLFTTRLEQLETSEIEFNVTNMTNRYQQAITALNNLQTNHAILDKVIKERQKNVHLNIPLTKAFLEVSGMSLEDLDKLKVIHVSGTKGKGKPIFFVPSRVYQLYQFTILMACILKPNFFNFKDLRVHFANPFLDSVDLKPAFTHRHTCFL